MKHAQRAAAARDASTAVREDVLEFTDQVFGNGISFSCRARDFGPVSVWVYAHRSSSFLRRLDQAVARTIREFIEKEEPDMQVAVRSPGEELMIDRKDGQGMVPLVVNRGENS